MTIAPLIDIALIASVAFASACCALYAVTWFDRRNRRFNRTIVNYEDDSTVFLFDGESLVDGTAPARRFLSSAPRGKSDRARLVALLTPQIPDIAEILAALPDAGVLQRSSDQGSVHLKAEMRGELIRLTLTDLRVTGQHAEVDLQCLEAMERELETLRGMSAHTPFLIWRQTPDAQITWVNRAYMKTVERLFGSERAEIWPPPALFENLPATAHPSTGNRRMSLESENAERRDWFECHSASLGDDILMTAVDVNSTVLAENQLREFTQTLTKTFAHLTIGLAVFDRARRLALFNPALTDLTGLPVDFLTGRPTLFGFLDKLRERSMIPEPKDYKSWRRKIVDLEAAATHGTYAETWTLPQGQTYRVTGRPHPDGAVAFLFEDISAEISLTRRFRAELETGQSVLDHIDDAVAVFSAAGVLVMTNRAYAKLWGHDPDTSLSDISIIDATRSWMAKTAATPVWGDIRDFITQGQDRSDWSAEVRLKNGRGLLCRTTPISGGATLVRFRTALVADRREEVIPQRA